MRDCKALRTWLQLAVALTGAACTTTRVVQRPLSPADISEIVGGVQDHEVTLLVDEDRQPKALTGRYLSLNAEQARLDDASGQRRSVPVDALRAIRYSRPGTGAYQGMGIGLLTGAALGAVAGLASGDDNCPSSGSFSSGSWCFFRFSAQEKAGLGAVGLGLVGMLVGGIVGGLAGAHAEVVLR